MTSSSPKVSSSTGRTDGGGLRSSAWFGADGRPGIIYRSWLRAEGYPPEGFDGRPVIGIANSWSELTPCNAHLRGLAEAFKRGVWQARGVPVASPTKFLRQPRVRPTPRFVRTLMALGANQI